MTHISFLLQFLLIFLVPSTMYDRVPRDENNFIRAYTHHFERIEMYRDVNWRLRDFSAFARVRSGGRRPC